MEIRVLSLEYISMVKTAIQTCVNPELKREVLCASGSHYNMKKACNQYDRKQQWNEIVGKKARLILKSRGLPEMLQDKVMSLIYAIGLRMLIWAEYHEGTLGFSREYSTSFLNSSHFTPQGIIDNKRVAEVMMEDESFSIKQKYKLACIYCITNKIDHLYRQMMEDKTEILCSIQEPKWIQKPEIVKFWSHQKMGLIDSNIRNSPLYRFRLQQAIRSGSKTAVEYFLSITSLKSRRIAVTYSAGELFRSREKSTLDDWIVFRDRRYDDSVESWVPNDYSADIMCFLLSNMTTEEQKGILKRDTNGIDYRRENFQNNRSRVLEFFLRWPYQDYFMKTADVMWGILPGITYVTLLLKICDEIEPRREKNLLYGEERSYDYRGLLKEFWWRSPEGYKWYVLENQTDTEVETKTGVDLLIKLLSLKEFTYRDEKIVRLILGSADDEQRENIISSKKWESVCIGLIKQEKWEILDRFALSCFLSKDEACKIKRGLSFTEVKRVCFYFAKFDKWNAIETFIKWISLPEDDINALKKEIIYSKDGKDECLKLLSSNRMKTFDKFIRWCLPSKKEAVALKRNLAYELSGECRHVHLTEEYIIELVDNFTKSNHPTKKEIKQFKKSVAYVFGCSICEELISDYSVDVIYDEKGYDVIHTRMEFRGGKWEKVDKFLTWCFSSKKEICDFKNKLLETAGVKIHLKLVKTKQWKEAKNFFAWLELCAEDIKDLKKRTLFHDREAWRMFSELVFRKDGKKFSYPCKEDEIDELLRWYLTDKETVLEFRDVFMLEHENLDEADLKSFDAIIQRYVVFLHLEHGSLINIHFKFEQCFRDLDREQRGVKRKSDTCSRNKKLCRLKLKGKKEQKAGTSSLNKLVKSQMLPNTAEKSSVMSIPFMTTRPWTGVDYVFQPLSSRYSFLSKFTNKYC